MGGHTMSNKTYDILRILSTIVLPAIAAFYVALASIWSLPYAEQISGTIAAVCTLFGALLKISSVQYMKSQEAKNGN